MEDQVVDAAVPGMVVVGTIGDERKAAAQVVAEGRVLDVILVFGVLRAVLDELGVQYVEAVEGAPYIAYMLLCKAEVE